MNKYGLIGNNISYSKSPKLHSIICDYFKLDFSYTLKDVSEKKLDDLLSSLDYKGFNITQPYKELIYNKVFSKTKIARKIGAINTIKIVNNKTYGENTDYYGLLELFKYYNFKLNDRKVIILGTGGAALASYYSLANFTNDIKFISRDKTNKLMPSIVLNYSEIDSIEYDLIINATPVGTYPNNESPLEEKYVSNKMVIDLVYNPLTTKLMTYSNKSYNGLVMLIAQALYSHKFWNNKVDINKEVIREIKERLINE